MRFHLIDALRGIAALWVVFFHAYEGGHLDNITALLPNYLVFWVFDLGESGVPIFFVISGFVMAHSLSKDSISPSYIGRFALRRSIRLDPPYWASIILVLVLAQVSAYVKGDDAGWPGFDVIFAHLFYLQGILGYSQINIIYWTLCLEIQFYLVFCLLLYFSQIVGKSLSNGRLLVFSFAAAVSLLWPTGILENNVYQGLFFTHWYAFLLGVFVYWSWKALIPKILFGGYLVTVAVFSVYQGSMFGMAAATTALIIYMSILTNTLGLNLWTKLRFLGLISYSLYLTHNPISGASYYVIYRILGDSALVQAFAFLLSTLISIVFAYLFWQLFERWSMKLSKKVPLHTKAS